jgi:CubicO group peptidase (beta-lactamase class C family)
MLRPDRPCFIALLALALIGAPGVGPAAARASPGATAPPSVTPAAAPAGPDDPAEVGAFFDQLVSQQLADKHIAGAAVAVVKDGALLFAKGYGHADVAKQIPVDADRTLFDIGSAGKLFTATAVMQLVEQGRIDLNADVNTYLDFRIPATYPEPVTTAHLLTHTAGFAEQYLAIQTTRAGVRPLRDFLVGAMPPRVYPPGRYHAYSNYGFQLAGYVVQRVSGEPFEQYLADHLLAPLGMAHSAAVQPLPAALAPDMSKGYTYRGGAYEATDFEWRPAGPATPSGAIRATAADVAKFMLAHLQDGRYGDARVLGAAAAQAMHRQQFTEDPRLPGIGYGFILSDQNGERILWHDGASARFLSLLALLPDRHVGLFVSYNTPAVAPADTVAAFVNRYYPAAAPPPRPIADPGLARFAGTYQSLRLARSAQRIDIGAVGELRVAVDGGDALAVGGHRYAETAPGLFARADGSGLTDRLAFATDAQGHVTGLSWGGRARSRGCPGTPPSAPTSSSSASAWRRS